MLGPLTEILCQLERSKRKFRWSCGTTNRFVTVAKALTLLLVLCLLYISVYSTLNLGTTSIITMNGDVKLNLLNQASLSPLEDNNNAPYGQLRKSIWNKVENSDGVENEKQSISISEGIATEIIKSLTQNFKKADKDGNGLLDEKELTTYIKNATDNHLEKAMKDNFDHYFQIDINPRNGLVSWEEYLNFFFKSKFISGITSDDIRNRSPAFVALPKDIKVEISRLVASWSESATNSPEYLTVDEFLAFEHPESSPTRILANLDDLFIQFDLDGDDSITTKELELTYKHGEGVDSIFKHEKHKIDTDRNGIITRIELMRYMDPRSIHHSQTDAKELIRFADKDKDGRLSLLELAKSANIVVKSKFYNVENNLHNH